MKLSIGALFLAPLTASAAAAPKPNWTWSTNEYCATQYGTTYKSSVKTTTITHTWSHTYTSTKTITPSTTTTPKAPTTTISSTVTSTKTNTAPTPTDTTTVTSTETDTATSTETDTDTVTTTNTATTTITEQTTSTIPTPAGFTPVQSVPSVNGRGNEYTGTQKRAAGLSKPRKGPITNKLSAKCPARYPQSVTCYKNVNGKTVVTKTVTASTKTITAPTPHTSTTSTTIVDSTTTTITPASTTVTATDTDTTTITDTTTVDITTTVGTSTTTTSTAFDYVATTYAACSGANLIDAVSGSSLTDFNRPNAGSFVGTSADSAYGCCVSCQTTNGCLGFGYSLSGIDFGCLLIQSGGASCDPSTSNWQFFHDSASGTVVIGDGPCGQGTYTS